MIERLKTSFYSEEELAQLGLKSYGKNVRLSRKCSLYNPHLISIGHDVRIDDFCILSGLVTLGSYIHIGAYSALYGSEEIVMEDFSGLSSRVSIYTVSEDYLGEGGLTNPTVPKEYRKADEGPVKLGKHSIIGAGTIILPNAEVGEGTAVGALALVVGKLRPWTVATGAPARPKRDRRRDVIEKYEAEMRAKGLV